MLRSLIFFMLLFSLASLTAQAETLAERGYRLLVTKPYVPASFHESVIKDIWQVWPAELKEAAEKASPEERRRMVYARYGLSPRPDDPSKPLQFVVDEAGNWTTNCFTCHGGKVGGKLVPGLPNSHYALQTLTEESRAFKLKTNQPLAPIEFGSLFMPLGTTNGTTNAVIFGIALAHYRDKDLNVVPRASRPEMLHHDMDAPPWWHFRKKQMLYIDGFAEKGHRGLLQMALDKRNGPEKFREWEEDSKAIFAYLESLEAPAYPFSIDQRLSRDGEVVFRDHCARCHGSYGKSETYPHRMVPIEDIGTDRARFDALTPEHRASYGRNWFSQYGKEKVVANPAGYMAPPLDGVWASAPYFHNGSVPTLWHVLHPDKRPVVWYRTPDGYDSVRIGLEVEEFATIPNAVTTNVERRAYFDTRRFGKSAAGHTYPDALSEDERAAVLEYLKTL